MSTVCLKVFTDSVPSFWHIETAWGGLKNEPQPTATISDIDPPPSGMSLRNYVHIFYLMYPQPKKLMT